MGDRVRYTGELDQEGATLVELVNRTIDRGVVLRGEVVIQVADIDLVSLNLDLVLQSVVRGRPRHVNGSGG